MQSVKFDYNDWTNKQRALMNHCRTLREEGRPFKIGDECWFDLDTISKYGKRSWVTEDRIIGRGPEWIVREVCMDGVYASYLIEHAPEFFEWDQLIPLC